MTTRIFIRRNDPRVISQTPSSQGNFDTAACADAGAARMRNMTAPIGAISHNNWDQDRTSTPPGYVEVADRPE
jgi:hypothetical protein